MEPLEQQRQLLRRDGIPQVPHRHPGLAVDGGDAQIHRGAGAGELGGVFQQVVDDLGDHVVVAQHQDGLLRNVRVHIQVPVRDLLLHGDQHPAHALADVKVAAGFQGVDGLQLAHIQHPPHHAGQAAALVGDDLQVLLLPLRRDGAVQNAVRVAGDGGHGGLQLMGDIGDEFPALPLRLLEGFRHGVEGGGQLTDLIVPAVVVHADVKVALRVPPGGLHHLPDGLHLAHGGDGGGHEGDHQHHKGRHEEQADEALPHGIQRGSGRHTVHLAHHFLGLRVHGGHAHHEAAGLIQPAQAVPPGGGAFFQYLPAHGLRHGDDLPLQSLVSGQEDMPLRVADHEVHIGHDGGKGGQLLEIRVAAQVLDIHVAAVFQIVDGKLAHDPGLCHDLLALLAPGIVIAQGEEGGAQQKQRQKHHAGGDEHLPPVQALELFAELFHAFALFSGCWAPPSSSNL